MAQTPDFSLPYNDLIQYVPQNLRNQAIKGLIDNLFNRFMTHDESIPLYGYVGRKPPSPDDRTGAVPQPSVERSINAVIPVLNFTLGTEKHTFTVQDLINKAKVLGISPGGLQWLYSQANNYLPPIDLDRFANYYNYFWVAKALPAKPSISWNADLLPEYYTIAKPKQTDADKLNAVVSTTHQIILTGTGFNDQSFTLTFNTPLTFTVTANNSLGAYSTFGGGTSSKQAVLSSNQYACVLDPIASVPSISQDVFTFKVLGQGNIVNLVSFTIVRDPLYDADGNWIGNADFAIGDTFNIDTTFLSRNYNVVFTGSPGVKGKIKSIESLNEYQVIDGVKLQEGQRVLVKNNSLSENGIYVVGTQSWSRASDYSAANIMAGARVWVSSGTINAGKLFTSMADNSWSLGVLSENNTSDWQEGNFWLHADELGLLNLTRADVVQAVRPIIEYNSTVQLNAKVSNGLPTDAGSGSFKQKKTEFNQLPMFDLFRYDGTHANLVSSIFYYVEDLTADLDLDLQKRVKTSSSDSADYIFNHGLVDVNGDLLFYKVQGALKSIWHAGYSEASVIDQTFLSDNKTSKGSLTDVIPTSYTQQQIWTLRAESATSFTVEGSKTVSMPSPLDKITVGVPYSSADFSCTITGGLVPFAVDDTFLFRIGNIETPRYVYQDANDALFDLYGGEAADVSGIGAYQVPRPFMYNPYNESRDEVLEGTLYSHFRGILQNQLPEIQNNYAFGGSIKNWSEQQTLLASLLMQRDLTPISVIDLAQSQYEIGLNTIADIYKQSIAQYFTSEGVVNIDGSAEQNLRLADLLASILAKRSTDNDVRTVLYDSTASVIGFPATLPQLGILPLVQPSISFDNQLGRMVLSHHDGHASALNVDDLEFRRAILNNSADISVLRSDGTSTPAVGSFTSTAPTQPYRGELWIRPDGVNSLMYAFDVDSDLAAPLKPVLGTTWYERESGPEGTLSIWDGAQWVSQPTPSVCWRLIDLADTLNHLLLLVESRLHDGINPNARKVNFTPLVSDPAFREQLKRELFTFATNNGLDPLGSDYNAGNAFTWNYSGGLVSNFPALSMPSVPARWYNVLKSHQATFPGVIPTERPNLEPWMLFGFSSEALWRASPSFLSSYAPIPGLAATINAGTVRVASTSAGLTSLVGLQVIDGISLNNGDRVLLQNEPSPENNGVWVASVGTWTRVPMVLDQNTFVTVLDGIVNYGTVWALSTTVNTLNSDPILFKQVRLWSDKLWMDIQAKFGSTFKLSVDTTRDILLPPYVSSSVLQSVNALTTVMPTGAMNTYAFGDGGPVETVWFSTIEFGYSMARALFRHDPLQFLGFCWGFNWVEVDGVLYDGYDMNTPGHKRFRLHGESVRQIVRGTSAFGGAVSGTVPIDLTITYDAYEVDVGRYQNFSIRNTITKEAIGYLRVGTASSVMGASVSLMNVKIQDGGQPFHIGDKFRVTANADGSNMLVTFTPSTTYSYLGFGQTFTAALRASAVDTTDSYAIEAYRGWDVNMGYRAGGLVATDDLKVRTDADTLSTSSYELIFKKNEHARDLWVQGLRITVTYFGAGPSYNTLASYISKNDALAPSTDGSDWIFRIEGYNPRYAKVKYFSLDTAGNFETFNVLDQSATSTVWKQYTSHTGTVNSLLPVSIIGIQNVANFLFGYSQYLNSEGWEFNIDPGTNVDAETGRARTWQLEVEKFIDRCYRGLLPNQGHIVNPFMDQLWVRQDTGLLSQFTDTSLFDITGHPGIFDIAGVKMPSTDLYVVRGNEVSQFGAAAPMYSAHAQLDECEHLFLFNNFVEDSISKGVLYQPFSGSRVVTYKFNGRQQASRTFRPEFGGHYLVGSEVRQNLQASTDNITNFYDANHSFESDMSTRHALALLGFSPKTYFSDLDISDKTQFNFWRGLIQSKGTNMSIGAYLNNDRFEDAKIDEYWAYKVATFGDARQKTYPELKLTVDDTVQQFTQLQFDAVTPLPNFTQISRFDEARWFSIDDLDQDAYFKAEVVGTYNRTFGTDLVYPIQITLPFIADKLSTFTVLPAGEASQINATTINVVGPCSVDAIGQGPATPRYNPIKLFNYVASELVQEIPLWHPAFGQHTPTALESINVISVQNPAKYNFSTQVVNNNSYDPLRPWGSNELGRTWFDTSNLSYIPYFDENIFTNRSERLSRWGTLADFATVDVYEWVQSPVPPAEYNALALSQAGNADLDPATKAAGEVALKESYVRDRLWSIRPIAWSYSPVPADVEWGGSPPFDASFNSKLYFENDGRVSLELGTFADFGIVAGMRVGAWDPTDASPKPLSEYNIEDKFSKVIVYGDAIAEQQPTGNVSVSFTSYTPVVGQLLFSAGPNETITTRRADASGQFINEWDNSILLKVTSASGLIETVQLGSAVGADVLPGISGLHGASVTSVVGDVLSVTIPSFGISVSVTVTTGGTFSADVFQQAIVSALSDQVTLRDAVLVSEVVSNQIGEYNVFPLSNDPLDPETYGNYNYGWRAWSVPTQAQLDADGRQPTSSWKPYLGDFITVTSFKLPQVQDAVAYNKAPLTLNNGVIVERYNTSWADWFVLKNTVYTSTQTAGPALDIAHTSNIDAAATSVYVNGIAQLKAAYTIIGKVLTLASVSVGSIVTVIIRKYEPSAAELAFNPVVSDDLTFQQQYKQDYEYVSLPVRDSEGSLSSSLYYFWVKNKSTAANGKKLSIQSIAQELRDGPSNYLTFQHLIGTGTDADLYRYDAITVSGLSYLVAKDDTFKLRFTRNFTLRDDPQNLELKDTHTEWSLIRPGQRSKIPEALWQKLTDSVSGSDAAGSTVPALRRTLYDERSGTRTQFGFGAEQTLAPKDLLISSITYSIVNTKLINKSVPASSNGVYPPDFIEFLDFNQSDSWFATPAAARKTMTDIWTTAKTTQVNDIFFASLNDILASNYELSDIFKTSRLSAYSIKVVAAPPIKPTYE